MKKIFLLTFLTIIMAAGQAMASKPIQLSLTPNFAIYSRTTQIEGLSLSIWGENPQTSLALGFFNGFTGSSKGFALGIFLNYSDSYKGVQWGGVNYTKGSMLGWQAGIVDYVDGSMKGVQTGLVNYAGHLKGVQFGLVNYAETATTGVQIGVINLMPQNRWFANFPDEVAPGMILLNWRF
jgi:hypothetical protein